MAEDQKGRYRLRDGYVFGVTENHVWCTEQVPVAYVARYIYTQQEAESLSETGPL